MFPNSGKLTDQKPWERGYRRVAAAKTADETIDRALESKDQVVRRYLH
jgi:hypothetical protein